MSNIELDADVKPSCSHSSLTTLEENGEEVKILRDNMPFGKPGMGSLVPILSATPVRQRRLNRCWKTCLSAARLAITTVCSTTAAR